MRFLQRFEPQAYAALRIVSGLLFFCHGLQKVFGVLEGKVQPLGTQLWLGGWIELLGGLCIALGLFTRIAAFVSSGTMAVAYVQYHWKFAVSDFQWVPMVNHGELSVAYTFLFLYLATQGPGRLSADSRMGRR